MLLKTCTSLSEMLVRLTMTLHRRPDLVGKIRSSDEENRKGIAEASAENIQKIFTTCTMDRSSGRPNVLEGKKVGMYKLANLVLKLLFAVGASFFLSFHSPPPPPPFLPPPSLSPPFSFAEGPNLG